MTGYCIAGGVFILAIGATLGFVLFAQMTSFEAADFLTADRDR